MTEGKRALTTDEANLLSAGLIAPPDFQFLTNPELDDLVAVYHARKQVSTTPIINLSRRRKIIRYLHKKVGKLICVHKLKRST